MVEKNYSYLAIQLSKFCQAYGRRQLEIAFLQLREHVLKVDTHQVSSYICKLHELPVRFLPEVSNHHRCGWPVNPVVQICRRLRWSTSTRMPLHTSWAIHITMRIHMLKLHSLMQNPPGVQLCLFGGPQSHQLLLQNF